MNKNSGSTKNEFGRPNIFAPSIVGPPKFGTNFGQPKSYLVDQIYLVGLVAPLKTPYKRCRL